MKEILLSAIACPKCHGQLQYDVNNQQLICQVDNLVYAIKDNIPVLLESEAKPLNQSQPVQK
ncbi:hypothetical protein A9G22_08730 [Gilliamella sp. App2-1]|uniref:Trm112 family protein n=1 Tax=Gilliamella sp. App2-1 TaxID=3120230 RepID=UPI000828172C|nr:Trm112 family protein [Gilliamella apicola]OCG21989.1 hypothetical protein A9G22_08730 [Gilliamella apicola]